MQRINRKKDWHEPQGRREILSGRSVDLAETRETIWVSKFKGRNGTSSIMHLYNGPCGNKFSFGAFRCRGKRLLGRAAQLLLGIVTGGVNPHG